MKSERSKYEVTNEHEHADLIAQVDALMRKGENNVTTKESEEIRRMGLALQKYELENYPISTPKTFEGIVELHMYEMRLKQFGLAKT